MLNTVLAIIAFVLAALVAGFFSYGPRNSLTLIGGNPDLGPVDFATLKRRETPNDALACPPGFCPNAKADFEPPVYAVGAIFLGDALAKVVAEEDRVDFVSRPDGGMALRAVQRSRRMQFPDTVDVVLIALDENRSTLAIYARAKFGSGDVGVNLARIKRWLRKVDHLREDAGSKA